MKKLGSTGVKVLKIFHLFFAMLWICGAIALATIAFISEPSSGDELFMRSRIIQIIDDLLIIPGAIGCLLTGIIYGVWTNWGFFKHRWLTVKWVMTIAQMSFGTFILGPWVNDNVIISDKLRDAAFTDPSFISNFQNTQFWGSIQTSLLLLYIIISVIKPWKKSKQKKE